MSGFANRLRRKYTWTRPRGVSTFGFRHVRKTWYHTLEVFVFAMELRCQYAYGETRFVCDEHLAVLRKALCEAYFANLTGSDAAVLENGPGCCHLINNARASLCSPF
jgi:hypothetical protein